MELARLRFYLDSQLNATAKIKDVLQHAWSQEQGDMGSIINITHYGLFFHRLSGMGGIQTRRGYLEFAKSHTSPAPGVRSI